MFERSDVGVVLGLSDETLAWFGLVELREIGRLEHKTWRGRVIDTSIACWVPTEPHFFFRIDPLLLTECAGDWRTHEELNPDAPARPSSPLLLAAFPVSAENVNVTFDPVQSVRTSVGGVPAGIGASTSSLLIAGINTETGSESFITINSVVGEIADNIDDAAFRQGQEDCKQSARRAMAKPNRFSFTVNLQGAGVISETAAFVNFGRMPPPGERTAVFCTLEVRAKH